MGKYRLYLEGEENNKLFTDYLESHGLTIKETFVMKVVSDNGRSLGCDYLHNITLSDDDLIFVQLACNIARVIKVC